MQTRRTRFLPKALTIELRLLPWRLLGASLLGISAACWLALISWSYADPTSNYVTLSQPHNWLGHRGASVADRLMQCFGLASPFLILPLAALGLRIAGGHRPSRPWRRAGYWAAAALILPAFFATFPAPGRWVLDSSLGGIVGDFIANRVGKLLPLLPGVLLWPAFGLLFLVAGAWCAFRACGLTAKALSIALHGETAAKAAALGSFEPDAAPKAASEPLTSKVTSWVTRFSSSSRALTLSRAPREYMMTKVRTEPRLPSVAEKPQRQDIAVAEKPRRQDVAEAEKKRAGAPSPFADWGSRPAPPSGLLYRRSEQCRRRHGSGRAHPAAAAGS